MSLFKKYYANLSTQTFLFAAAITISLSAHFSRESYKSPEDMEVWQEHADAVAEEGSNNSERMCRGVIQPCGVRQYGIYWGFGYFQVSGTDVGPVRWRLASGLLKFQEGAPSMEPARGASKKRVGGTPSVINVLSGSGAGGVTLWGVDLDFAGRNL